MSDKINFEGVEEIANIDVESLNEVSEATPQESPLNPQQELEIQKEVELEKKYGDQGLRTFLERAASSASFGISDQVLTKTGLASEEELRERKIRNDEAASAGVVAGILVPSLATGGTSLAARGLSSGVASAAKAGLAAEQITAKALQKIIAETGQKKIAQEVLKKSISKGAGSAVEGSLYGVGELISENALGQADFNAENLITSAGAGAILGGVAGGAFGLAEVVVPVIKDGKVVNFINKKVKESVDPVKNSWKVAGKEGAKLEKFLRENSKVAENAPKVFKDIIEEKGLPNFASNQKLSNSLVDYIEEKGVQIGKSLEDITSMAEEINILPTRAKIAAGINKRLIDFSQRFKDEAGVALPTAKAELKKVQKIIKDFDDDLMSTETYTASGLNDLKKKYQTLSNWGKKGQLPLNEEINREVSRAIREEILNLADNVGEQAGAKLRQELLDYGTAIELSESMLSKLDKDASSNFLNFRDLMLGSLMSAQGFEAGVGAIVGKKLAQSDLTKKLGVLVGIEKANKTVEVKVSNGVKNFMKGKDIAKNVATKSILASPLALNLESEKPKKPADKKEAFKNIQTNLVKMAEDPTAFTMRGNLEDSAPNTHLASQGVLNSAIYFLQQKLPNSYRKTSAIDHLMKRSFQPSEVELSKFERYLEAIENPITVVDRLEAGNVSREGVEAIKTVYPNLYQRLQTQVLEQVQNNPEAIDYTKRLQLGILLDIPTDAALNPENIAALQSLYKEVEQSQSGGALAQIGSNQPISATRASKLDMAESQATEIQKISNRTDLK